MGAGVRRPRIVVCPLRRATVLKRTKRGEVSAGEVIDKDRQLIFLLESAYQRCS